MKVTIAYSDGRTEDSEKFYVVRDEIYAFSNDSKLYDANAYNKNVFQYYPENSRCKMSISGHINVDDSNCWIATNDVKELKFYGSQKIQML